MPERDHVIAVVGEWVEKAENDMTNAVHTLTMGADAPADTVCFHAQQVAEKYLKALLVLEGVDFPKTHDIGELMAQSPFDVCRDITVEDRRRLTTYATVARYPGGPPAIGLGEARAAVSLARRVRKAIRKLLPRKALRPRTKRGRAV